MERKLYLLVDQIILNNQNVQGVCILRTSHNRIRKPLIALVHRVNVVGVFQLLNCLTGFVIRLLCFNGDHLLEFPCVSFAGFLDGSIGGYGSSDFQIEFECAAFPWYRGNSDATSLEFREFLTDEETQSGALQRL